MTLRLNGSTSGYVDVNAPAVAGTTTITMPSSNGTLIVTGGTAPVQFPAGNVTNPSITSNVSSTAGVWFPAANTIAISTSSAEVVRIDSSGNVGIGRTPVYKLDAAINSGGAARFATNSGTAANDAGVIMFTTSSATPASREAGVYIDGNGGDGTGADYAFFLHRGDNRAILGNQSNGPLELQTNGTERMRIDSSGNVIVTGAGGLGYGTGSGGTVTQLTSKGTGVTINKANGRITTASDALAAGATATFTVTNSAMAGSDVVVLNVTNGNYSGRVYNNNNGSFIIALKNETGSSLSDAVVINFAIIKAVTS
jgi:hypothetical protein